MFSLRKSLVYLLIFTVVGAFAAYHITIKAYEDTGYDREEYSFAIGVTDEYYGQE